MRSRSKWRGVHDGSPGGLVPRHANTQPALDRVQPELRRAPAVAHRLAPAARSSHKHWGRVEMTSLRQISTTLPSRGVRIDGWDWGTPVAIAVRVAANAASGTTTRATATMHARATAAHRISTALPSIGQPPPRLGSCFGFNIARGRCPTQIGTNTNIPGARWGCVRRCCRLSALPRQLQKAGGKVCQDNANWNQ